MNEHADDYDYNWYILEREGLAEFSKRARAGQVSRDVERRILEGRIDQLTSQRNSYCFWMTVFLFAAVVFLILGALT